MLTYWIMDPSNHGRSSNVWVVLVLNIDKDNTQKGKELNQFVLGKMFLLKLTIQLFLSLSLTIIYYIMLKINTRCYYPILLIFIYCLILNAYCYSFLPQSSKLVRAYHHQQYCCDYWGIYLLLQQYHH